MKEYNVIGKINAAKVRDRNQAVNKYSQSLTRGMEVIKKIREAKKNRKAKNQSK